MATTEDANNTTTSPQVTSTEVTVINELATTKPEPVQSPSSVKEANENGVIHTDHPTKQASEQSIKPSTDPSPNGHVINPATDKPIKSPTGPPTKQPPVQSTTESATNPTPTPAESPKKNDGATDAPKSSDKKEREPSLFGENLLTEGDELVEATGMYVLVTPNVNVLDIC